MPNSKNTYLKRTLAFHEIYQTEILPIFKSYEVYRKSASKKLKQKYILAILCVLAILWLSPILFALALCFEIQNMFFTAFIVLFPFCLEFVGLYMLKNLGDESKGFRLTLKHDCLARVLKVFGDIEWKNDENIIADSELRASGLFADYNRRDTDDEFEGSHNGINFKICETYLKYYHGSGSRGGVIDIFKGVVIAFETNKNIKNRTMVSTKGDLTQKNTYLIYLLIIVLTDLRIILEAPGLLSYVFSLITLIGFFWYYIQKLKENNTLLDEVKLEDPWFGKKFNVYSSDQVEARYLVTPSFMERFNNLKTVFGAKNAKCSFCGDKVIIAISTKKNLFEIGEMFKSLEDPKSINSFYDELSSIYKMISYFKFDEKTGL